MVNYLAIAGFVSTVILSSHAQEDDVPPEQKFPQTPLSEKRFEYNQLPYKVDTDVGLIRGEQHGYNICNSTTEGQTSLCQTAVVNSIDDFCFWSAPDPNSMVGDTEGEAVAYCSKAGHGARLFPEGAIQGLQFTRTPDYVQIVGFIDQTLINLAADDFGGEMDPHGADLRGNPLGGLVFSNAWTGNYQQVVEWHNFVGSNYFCMKACDPSKSNAADYCEHIFDRIGCAYNAPSNAQFGEFTSCDGDNQLFPGRYVENGQTMTYTQPPESLGPITTMPYTTTAPASSNCQTFSSAQIFTAQPSPSKPAVISGTTYGSAAAAQTGSGTATSAGANPTGAASTGGNSPSGALPQQASNLSVYASLVIVAFSTVFALSI